MEINQEDFQKIVEFMSLNSCFIDDNYIPKSIGDGQSNPTFLIKDINKKSIVIRTQPVGNLVRGAHRVDREFLVLNALHKKKFEVPEPLAVCNTPELIGRMFYVMSFEEGDINFDPFLPNENYDDKKKIYKSLAEVLGKLHGYSVDSFGLPFKRNQGFMKRNLSLWYCLLYTSPSPRDRTRSRMPSSA